MSIIFFNTTWDFPLQGNTRLGSLPGSTPSFADVTLAGSLPALTGSGSITEAVYHFTDHQGNVRLRYNTNADCEEEKMLLLNVREYMPFGTVLREWTNNQGRYAFQGQEHDPETGYDYFKYRMYDAETGRFNGVDPLRGKYPHNSAFAFSENRVVDGVELEGLEVFLVIEESNILKRSPGHTFISTMNEGKFTTFSYGRYGALEKDKGSANFTNGKGEGVLLKFEGREAIDFVKKSVSTSDGQIYRIDHADAGAVFQYFNDLFESTEKSPESGVYMNSSNAKVIDEYDIQRNNCTTISCNGIKAGIENSETDNGWINLNRKGEFHSYDGTVVPDVLSKWMNWATGKDANLNPNITKIE